MREDFLVHRGCLCRAAVLAMDHRRKPDRVEVTRLMSAFPKHLKKSGILCGRNEFFNLICDFE